MQVSINSITQSNNNGSISDGNKGDIIVSNNGNTWLLINQQLSNRFIYGEIPSGSSATFTSSNPFIPESVVVYINGLKQLLSIDYTTSGLNNILLTNSLQVNDTIQINYIKA